ncbi:MAG: HAD family hydrolase [Actinomycetota bacterium]|nr:HAD family hydrolase [Actinomycetota bacterium]
MTSVSLVVTDLDGTFWHSDDQIPPEVVAAAGEVTGRGVPLLVATGRRLASTRRPLARVGLTPPAVVLNGALGLHLGTGERFHLAPYPAEQALAAYDAFVGVGLSPVVYVDGADHDVYFGHDTSTHATHVRGLSETAGVVRGPGDDGSDELRAIAAQHPVLGFSVLGMAATTANDAANALRPIVEVHVDRSIDVPGAVALTAAPAGQSKWDGVLAFCRAHDLDPTRVLAVADGPNDIELLTNAAVAVVPEVAHELALELADHVIPSAADGGWREILPLLN